MYREDMKKEFEEIESVDEIGHDELLCYAEECKAKLYDRLDDEGVILLEKFLHCLELIDSDSDYEENE